MPEAKLKAGDKFRIGSDVFEVITVSAQYDQEDNPSNFKYEVQLHTEAEAKRQKEAAEAKIAAEETEQRLQEEFAASEKPVETPVEETAAASAESVDQAPSETSIS
jgi:hypothetical protein